MLTKLFPLLLYGKTLLIIKINNKFFSKSTYFSIVNSFTTICFVSFVSYSVFNEHLQGSYPLVEMMGLRSRRELRALVARGHKHPPEVCSVPLVFESIVFNFQEISFLGGDDGIRTHDPLLAGQVLSQLSYTPI